jgi:Alpha/beta hydrolase domain
MIAHGGRSWRTIMLRLTTAAVTTALGLIAGATGAQAVITELRLEPPEPFVDGHRFGEVGAYERIRGTAKGELDPAAPENKVVVNLDKAERNARGMVEYETDVYILRPAEPGRGSGILLYEVTNRGRKLLLPYVHDAARVTQPTANDPKSAADLGNAFVFERGHTIVWSGWDPDAPKTGNGLAAKFPVAMEKQQPVSKRIREEIQVGTRGPADVAVARLSYPVASRDKSRARLTVRAREGDQRTELAPDRWDFADLQSIRLLPEGTKFEPTKIYELWYEAKQPKVLGIGYAGTRDLVSFLRHERTDPLGAANPLAAGDALPRHAIALGISQSGRYLRHHLELGMNKDERGRKVFDGVLAHISGAGKVFANHEFGMPARTATQHEDRFYPENWFPFAHAAVTDPLSGRTDGLLRGDGSDPLVIETNTSTEYWQKGASLIHSDPAGKRDAEVPPGARVYLIAGTQHGGRAGTPTTPAGCANPRNPHSAGPVLRALLVALEEWVARGTAPPASRVPSIAAGTAVDPTTVKMPVVSGFSVAKDGNPIGLPVDWVNPPGSDERAFVVASSEAWYGTRVSAVDADGNEVAGIRTPDIAVPLATYTGWNVYRAEPGELCDRDGSYLPFAKTRAEREAAGDPRPSVEERYGNRDAYVANVKAAADALVAERLLLRADADAFVKAAEASDRF